MVAEFEALENEAKAGTLQKRLRRKQMTQLKEQVMEYLGRLIFLIDKLN